MSRKRKFLIIIGLGLFIALSLYFLIYVRAGITSNTILVDVEDISELEEGQCIKIENGKRVCLLQKGVSINSGGVVEEDFDVMFGEPEDEDDQGENDDQKKKCKKGFIKAEDFSCVNNDFYDD